MAPSINNIYEIKRLGSHPLEPSVFILNLSSDDSCDSLSNALSNLHLARTRRNISLVDRNNIITTFNLHKVSQNINLVVVML